MLAEEAEQGCSKDLNEQMKQDLLGMQWDRARLCFVGQSARHAVFKVFTVSA